MRIEKLNLNDQQMNDFLNNVGLGEMDLSNEQMTKAVMMALEFIDLSDNNATKESFKKWLLETK
jgi:hypothetical protein